MNVLEFLAKKESHKKISMVACYDYLLARIIAQSTIDAVLVGDSVAMTVYGHQDTIAATVSMMCAHTRGVKRGIGDKFIVTDLPFLSYRQSISKSIAAVKKIMQAGAQAVKLENADGNVPLVKHLVESGIPVMGHLGLSIQAVNSLGGFKVQGKTEASAKKIKDDALLLQEAGCFAIVLECIPSSLGKEISEALTIPTIGVGAGPYTDGQILVMHDLLGLNLDFKPKFVKIYTEGGKNFVAALNSFVNEINSGEYPQDEYSYKG